MVEHHICNVGVTGSNPVRSKINDELQRKSELLTAYINRYYPKIPWTLEESSEQILQSSKSVITIFTVQNQGQLVKGQIMGNSIFINGEEITGNLGNKTTYGDYSPIVGENNGTLNNGPRITESSFFIDLFVTVIGGLVVFALTYFLLKYFKKRNL